jgi:hypothetical protein
VLGAAVAALSCGKRGDPLPPLPVTPQPVTNLKLAQRGARLEVSYVAPRATTGGVRLGVLDVELLRADSSAAELEGGDTMRLPQFLKAARRDKRRAAPGETLVETFPLPPLGTMVRVAARAIDRGHESNLSSVATLKVEATPPAPSALTAELTGETVELRWQGTVPTPPPPSPSPSPSPAPSTSPTPAGRAPSPSPSPSAAASSGPGLPGASPSPSASPAASPSPSPSPTPTPPARGFLVYRRRDPAGSYAAPVRSEPLPSNAFDDRTVSIGERWCYVVGTVVSTEPVVESERSNEACVSVRDIVAPATPTGVAALGGADGVEVSWSPSTDADLATYRVYRQAPDGARTRLGDVAPPATSWRDATAAPGARYVYTLTAVDTAGNESPPSLPAPGGRP